MRDSRCEGRLMHPKAPGWYTKEDARVPHGEQTSIPLMQHKQMAPLGVMQEAWRVVSGPRGCRSWRSLWTRGLHANNGRPFERNENVFAIAWPLFGFGQRRFRAV